MPEIGNNPILIQSFFSDHFDSAVHARQSLMVDSNRLAIALIEKNEAIGYEEFAIEEWSEELFAHSKIASLRQSLPAVILFRSDAAIFIPEVFRKSKEESTGHFFSLKEGIEIAEYKPSSFPASICFPVPKSTLALMRKQFPGALIMHHSLPVLMWMLNHSKFKQPAFLIEISQGKLFIYAVKENAPLFYNSFEVNSPEDAAYYTLFVMEQLEMDPVKQTVYYKVSEQDENLLSVCRSFISAFVSLDVLKTMKRHEHGVLFPFLVNALLCE